MAKAKTADLQHPQGTNFPKQGEQRNEIVHSWELRSRPHFAELYALAKTKDPNTRCYVHLAKYVLRYAKPGKPLGFKFNADWGFEAATAEVKLSDHEMQIAKNILTKLKGLGEVFLKEALKKGTEFEISVVQTFQTITHLFIEAFHEPIDFHIRKEDPVRDLNAILVALSPMPKIKKKKSKHASQKGVAMSC